MTRAAPDVEEVLSERALSRLSSSGTGSYWSSNMLMAKRR